MSAAIIIISALALFIILTAAVGWAIIACMHWLVTRPRQQPSQPEKPSEVSKTLGLW